MTPRSASQMRDVGYAVQGTGDREGTLLDKAFPPERLSEMLGRSRRIEADLVAHIAEVDERGLYGTAPEPTTRRD